MTAPSDRKLVDLMERFDLTIESSGEGWMGTFGIVLATLAEDILSDFGHSFAARLTWEVEGNRAFLTRDVLVLSVDRPAASLVVRPVDSEEARAIDIESIRKIEV